MAWEIERYDWSRLHVVPPATSLRVPAALEALRSASTVEEATEAYWLIDNYVVVQGALFDAAVATAACVVTMLSSAMSGPARERLVELLEQLSSGVPPENNPGLAVAVRNECLRGFGIYVALLQYGSDLERELCIELVLDCMQTDIELRDRVLYYLMRVRDDSMASERVRRYAAGKLDLASRDGFGDIDQSL